MDVSDHPEFDDHDQVAAIHDAATGLFGYIAVHSTRRGPAIGGCRVMPIPAATALSDVLRLSRAMTYKTALAELPAGGGKAVVYRVDPAAPRDVLFNAFAEAVDSLDGRYVTAQDMGCGLEDLQVIARRTPHVVGLPRAPGKAGGDTSVWTAAGLFLAIQVAVERPLSGARIAVQGLGGVGLRLCRHLHEAGARLIVADVDAAKVRAAEQAFGAEATEPEAIHRAPADVFSPNAIGGVVNALSVPELGAPVVCGAANNPLAADDDAGRLLARGITYVPDFLVNAGGIISVVAEHRGEAQTVVEHGVRRIADRTRLVLSEARAQKVSPLTVAQRVARDQLRAPRPETA